MRHCGLLGTRTWTGGTSFGPRKLLDVVPMFLPACIWLHEWLGSLPEQELGRLIQTLEEEMHEAAADLRFEYAARLRDEVNDLRRELRDAS